MSVNTIKSPRIVSRKEWLAARKELLAREKQHTREHDAIAAERRQLPWESKRIMSSTRPAERER